jgi:hypothetical protein
MWHIRSP